MAQTPDQLETPAPAADPLGAFTRGDPRYWCAAVGEHGSGCSCARPEDHSPDGLYLYGPHERAGTLGRHVGSAEAPAIAPSPAAAHARQELARVRAAQREAERVEAARIAKQRRTFRRLTRALGGQSVPTRPRRGDAP